MLRRRVLVIAHYFPPLAMGGVQRMAKFCKYLPDFGWEPVVLASTPEGYFALDQSMAEELRNVAVFRAPGLRPFFMGRGERFESRRSRLSKLARWLLVPDARVMWVPDALRLGRRLLERFEFDCIMASAPPYSALIVARVLAVRADIPLVVDFRDAWVDSPFAFFPTAAHARANLMLERWIVSGASRVLSINEQILSGFKERHGSDKVRYEALSQGFDPEDFTQEAEVPPIFTVCYTGSLIRTRRPDDIVLAASELVKEGVIDPARFRVEVVGFCPAQFRELAGRLGMEEIVRFRGYVPHRESVGYLLKAHVLWLYVAESEGETVLTGKLFEYLGSRKRVIASVPLDGAAARLVREMEAGTVVRPGDVSGLKAALADCYRSWLRGETLRGPGAGVDAFDRRLLSGRLAEILDEVAGASGGENHRPLGPGSGSFPLELF